MERAQGEESRKREDVNVGASTLGTNYTLYPPALAKYEDIIMDPRLFRESLEKLHFTLGTKFMVPTVGGKELDLHKLFVEVTTRGGIEKVIKERKLKEITSAFNFPPTATNASFVLRKYYLSLLHHYEQLYFFQSKGWNFPNHGFQAPSSGQGTVHKLDQIVSLSQDALLKRQRMMNDPLLPTASNTPVVGVIDGKFENGYLVTVRIGEVSMRGILYHISQDSTAQLPSAMGNNASSGGRRRRKKKLSKLDPTHPKPNRSGYNFFFAEQHARLKQLHSGKDREISKMIGELWNKLTETEKAVYQEIGLKDKERYQSEMVVYREKRKMGSLLISNAVPIQQLSALEEEPLLDMNLQAITNDDGVSSDSDLGGSSTESDSDIESPEAGPDLADDSLKGTNNYKLCIRDQPEKENEALQAGPSNEPVGKE